MSQKNSLINLGAKPINIKWNVVRGDEASLKVQFLEQDEETSVDISSWQFAATAYNKKEATLEELEVKVQGTNIFIIANSFVTELWGQGIGTTVAELTFDLQVSVTNQKVWTPIVGTIVVIGDVTGVRL